MNALPSRLRAFLLAAGVALLASSGWAVADPPSRVARLGYLSGPVSFSPAGEDNWVQAGVNRPLTTGDRLWTDAGGRAELQVGGSDIRMGSDTGATILNLDDEIAQLQLTQGALNVRVRRLGQNQVFEVDTPNLAFTLRRRRLLPDRGRSRRAVHDHRHARRPGRGLRPGRRVRHRFRPVVPLHGHRPARGPAWRHAALRRFRSLVERTRPALRQLRLRPLRLAGHDRLPGSRCERNLARRCDLRQRLVPEPRRRRLGALPRRPLGLDRPVGLDLGG